MSLQELHKALIAQFKPFIKATAAKLATANPPISADDLEQEAYLEIVSHDGPVSVKDYAPIAMLRFIRREQRQYSIRQPDPTELEDKAEPDVRKLSELKRYMGRLPDKQRDVLRMIYYENMPRKTIAKELDVSLKTIHNWHRKAREALRRSLEASANSD